jgi:hypothetical protein
VRIAAGAVGIAVLALAIPASSSASLYCVGGSPAGCTFAYAATGDGLQQALTDADTNVDFDGTPDTVRIGPGTYKQTSGGDFHTTGGDITVEGAGQATVLTTDAANNRTVLHNTGGTGGAVRALRVDLAGTANGIYDFHDISDVRVSGPGTAIVGVHMRTGSHISRAVIDPAGILSVGVIAYGDSRVEDVVVRLHKAGNGEATAVALATDDPAGTANATVRHLTVLGDGQTFTAGVSLQADGDSAGARTLNANVRDTVLRNLSRPLERFAITNTAANPGTANLTYRYSSLDATKNPAPTGPGSTTAGPGNLPDPDPLFAPDLSLSPGSPLIDAGDPAGPEAGDSPTDLAGNPRIVGGRRDIGAFESQPGAAGAIGQPGSPVETLPLATVASAGALAVSPRAFRAAPRGPSVSAARRAPVGAIVGYTLNVDASVRFTVRQSLRGRRVRRGSRTRCVRPTRKNRGARGCRRLKTRGTFTQAGRAGPNSFRFRGRVRHRSLTPGRYVLIATPSANGVSGRATRAPFRIVR